MLHACRCWYCGCHPQYTTLERGRTRLSFSIIRAVVYGFSSNIRSKLVGLWRIILVFFCIFRRLVPGIFHAYSYDTYILVVRCMKRNKDAEWSLVLLLITGVRSDPKYSNSCDTIRIYLREDCYFWFFTEIFHFFSRYMVVSSRYDFLGGVNNMWRSTCRSDFVRSQAKTWKQPCVAFRGQGDAAVRQIASMNYSYGYTIVNCVWPHYSSISQLAGVLEQTHSWRRLTTYLFIRRTDHDLCYVDNLNPNLAFWGAVQGLYIKDPTQATCPRACSMCGSYAATLAKSHRSGIYVLWKS